MLILYGVGGSSLASHLHSRFLAAHGFDLLRVYGFIMALTTVWGSLLFSPLSVLGVSPWMWLGSLPLGAASGYLSFRCSRSISRLNRRGRGNATSARAKSVDRATAERTARVGVSPQRTLGIRKTSSTFLSRVPLSPLSLLAIAVFEELIFRGFFVQVAWTLSGFGWQAAVLVLSVLLFGLTHIFYGWIEVAAKLPLGALALLSVLAVNSTVPAIVAHVLFNWISYRAWRDAPRIAPAHGGGR